MAHKKIDAVGALLLFLVIASVFSRCAHPATPQGGPKDSLPPTIIEAIPIYGATNFTGNKVTISFNEYIQLKDQQKNFFISPEIGKMPTLTIKNRSLVIDLKSPLDSNTTYTLDFGNAVADNNEGNVLKGLYYVFSTGSYIDSMRMSGFVRDAYTLDTLPMAYAMLFDAAADSIPDRDSTVYLSKFRKLARTNDYGVFIANNIKPVDYRVYAFLDANNNRKYERGVDRIAFLDSVYNPTRLPEFSTWSDTANVAMADAQLFFDVFTESPVRRQNTGEIKRPKRNQLILSFTAPWPQIDSLEIKGISADKIIYEYLKPTRDSIALWFDVPKESIPDTLEGRFVYGKSDSLGQLVKTPYLIKESFFEKKDKNKEKEEQKAKEKAESEGKEIPREKNPFKYTVEVQESVFPEKGIPIVFDYPLNRNDVDRIRLQKYGKGDKRIPEKFTFTQDTTAIRRWILQTKWESGVKYNLEIPAGTFRNTNAEENDTLKADFSVADVNKFATFKFTLKGGKPDTEYIIEIADATSKTLKVINQAAHLTDGLHKIDYIKPGEVKIRVIEDSNRNGQWDTGELITRKHAELVRMLLPNGKEQVVAKANWEVEYEIDLADLFKPYQMQRTHLPPSPEDTLKEKLHEATEEVGKALNTIKESHHENEHSHE